MSTEQKQAERSSDWFRGCEWISQEGTTFWKRLREERGLSQVDVELKTSEGPIACVCWQRQAMFEDLPDMPELQELEALADLYETSPGALLDRCYEERGRFLREDEEGAREEAEETPNAN